MLKPYGVYWRCTTLDGDIKTIPSIMELSFDKDDRIYKASSVKFSRVWCTVLKRLLLDYTSNFGSTSLCSVETTYLHMFVILLVSMVILNISDN